MTLPAWFSTKTFFLCDSSNNYPIYTFKTSLLLCCKTWINHGRRNKAKTYTWKYVCIWHKYCFLILLETYSNRRWSFFILLLFCMLSNFIFFEWSLRYWTKSQIEKRSFLPLPIKRRRIHHLFWAIRRGFAPLFFTTPPPI